MVVVDDASLGNFRLKGAPSGTQTYKSSLKKKQPDESKGNWILGMWRKGLKYEIVSTPSSGLVLMLPKRVDNLAKIPANQNQSQSPHSRRIVFLSCYFFEKIFKLKPVEMRWPKKNTIFREQVQLVTLL